MAYRLRIHLLLALGISLLSFAAADLPIVGFERSSGLPLQVDDLGAFRAKMGDAEIHGGHAKSGKRSLRIHGASRPSAPTPSLSSAKAQPRSIS